MKSANTKLRFNSLRLTFAKASDDVSFEAVYKTLKLYMYCIITKIIVSTLF